MDAQAAPTKRLIPSLWCEKRTEAALMAHFGGPFLSRKRMSFRTEEIGDAHLIEIQLIQRFRLSKLSVKGSVYGHKSLILFGKFCRIGW